MVNIVKLPIYIEPATINVKPLNRINSCGIFLLSKSDLFINSNDLHIR